MGGSTYSGPDSRTEASQPPCDAVMCAILSVIVPPTALNPPDALELVVGYGAMIIVALRRRAGRPGPRRVARDTRDALSPPGGRYLPG